MPSILDMCWADTSVVNNLKLHCFLFILLLWQFNVNKSFYWSVTLQRLRWMTSIERHLLMLIITTWLRWEWCWREVWHHWYQDAALWLVTDFLISHVAETLLPGTLCQISAALQCATSAEPTALVEEKRVLRTSNNNTKDTQLGKKLISSI